MKQLATFIFPSLLTLTCQAQTMTLAECVNLGIAHNLQLSNARLGIEKGRLGVTQNRARLLPVIQGVAQFTDYLKNPVNVTTGTLLDKDFSDDPTWQKIKSMKYQSNAGILLNVPLYNQAILLSIDVAKTVESIQGLSFEKAKEELILQIGKVYYMAQTSKEQLRLTDKNLERMKELCEITEALFHQGVVMEVDLNRVRINRQMLETERAMQNTLHEQQLNMLRYLLDLPLDTNLEVTPMEGTFSPLGMTSSSKETNSSSLDALFTPMQVEGVSSQLPELQLAERKLQLIDQQIKTVKAGYLPTLSLTGYVGGLGYNEKFHQFTDHWFGNSYLGLSLRVPIFEANAKHLKIRQYRYDAQQAQNNYELLRKQIDRSYADAVLQMNRNMEIVKTQNECRKQAEEVYQIAEVQYKEGVASMTALLQDDMQLRSAQSSCIQAVCQCKLAQLDLLRLSGRLGELGK